MTPPHPPGAAPATLLTRDYSAEPDADAGPGVRVHAGRLQLETSGPAGFTAWAVDEANYRDVIVDAVVSLTDGDDDDRYGLFVRRSEPQSFWCFALTPTGRCLLARADGGFHPVAEAPLAAGMAFAPGLGAANRIQVVACGPCLTFVLNGMVVTGITVDPRYQEGQVGFYLQRGGSAPRSLLQVQWAQVRAVLPDQPAG